MGSRQHFRFIDKAASAHFFPRTLTSVGKSMQNDQLGVSPSWSMANLQNVETDGMGDFFLHRI